MDDLLKEHNNGEHRHSGKSPIRIVMNESYETSYVGVCDIDTNNKDGVKDNSDVDCKTVCKSTEYSPNKNILSVNQKQDKAMKKQDIINQESVLNMDNLLTSIEYCPIKKTLQINEIVTRVLSYLCLSSSLVAATVCTNWRDIVRDRLKRRILWINPVWIKFPLPAVLDPGLVVEGLMSASNLRLQLCQCDEVWTLPVIPPTIDEDLDFYGSSFRDFENDGDISDDDDDITLIAIPRGINGSAFTRGQDAANEPEEYPDFERSSLILKQFFEALENQSEKLNSLEVCGLLNQNHETLIRYLLDKTKKLFLDHCPPKEGLVYDCSAGGFSVMSTYFPRITHKCWRYPKYTTCSFGGQFID